MDLLIIIVTFDLWPCGHYSDGKPLSVPAGMDECMPLRQTLTITLLGRQPPTELVLW